MLPIIENISVEGTFNFRAVTSRGGSVLFYRSAALDKLSAQGSQTLQELGIERVIDLRSPQERATAAHHFDTVHIPLFGENTRPPAAGSLRGIYTFLINNSGGYIARAVEAMAVQPGRTLVHCRVGKDRTGLVVALASLAAGLDADQVLADYSHSGYEVRRHHEADARQEIGVLDLNQQMLQDSLQMHLESPQEIMVEILDMVDSKYGGPVNYLEQNGVPAEALDELRRRAAQ